MWQSKGIKIALVSLVIISMLLAGGCFNKAPTITSLTPSATSVARGDSCTVSCVASDPDTDDTLTYAWSATGGAVSGSGDTIPWIAPTTEGSYSITATVSDGKDTVTDSCDIQVVNSAPVITSLTSVTELPPEDSCTVSCVASDADGDTLTYTWSATDGTITGTGESVSWTAPAAEGTYTISVEVSDGHGGTASDSCYITVEVKYGSIDIQSDPAGAAVYLDGVDTGNITPYVITNLAPGTYDVLLDHYHYKYRQATVTVNPNETTYINWSLTYAPEQTLTIQPNAVIGKDTYVYITAPDDNWADREWITAGTGGANTARAYIQFNLDLLPDGAIITSVGLGLVYWATSNAAAAPIGVYNVEEAWGEDTLTWNNQPDFATEAESIVSVPAGVTDGFIYWTVTDLVKGWWDGTIANYGLALKDIDESTEEAWKRFYSSDWGTAHQRPELVITYFDPTS
jgi:hypothetical protein